MSDSAPVPAWVAEFLNRRTTVEIALRLPMNMRKKEAGAKVKGSFPEPPPLTPEQMWALADLLAVPAEFQPKP